MPLSASDPALWESMPGCFIPACSADQDSAGLITGSGRSHIGGFTQESGEESVAYKCILVSLMARFSHGVGEEGNIHVVSVLVCACIRESHDAVQKGVSACFIADEVTLQDGAAAVPLNKNLCAFGKSSEIVGAAVVLIPISG